MQHNLLQAGPLFASGRGSRPSSRNWSGRPKKARPARCMSPVDDKFAQALTSERLKAVYGAWKGLLAGRIGPRRAEMNPAHLRRATPWTFTVDVIDGGKDFRFGFAGDRVTQFLDRRCTAPTLGGLK